MAYIDSVATSTSKYTDKKVDASITNLGTTHEGRTMKMLKLAVQVRANEAVKFTFMIKSLGAGKSILEPDAIPKK